MKAVAPIPVLVVLFLALTLPATSRAQAVPDLVPSSTLAPEFVVPIDPPHANTLPAPKIDRGFVKAIGETRVAPNMAAEKGAESVLQRAATNPRVRGRYVGILAEEDFLVRNPNYKPVASPIAPHNDVWVSTPEKKFHGVQIKTHAKPDHAHVQKYVREMFKDGRAHSFAIPDDHYPAVRRELERRLERAFAKGDANGVRAYQRQLMRLTRLGRTYGELEQAVLTTARHARHARAFGGAASYAGIGLLADSLPILWRTSQGDLTSQQVQVRAAGAVAKITGTGAVVGAMVLAGASPVSMPVVLVGGVTYFSLTLIENHIRPAFENRAMTAEELELLRTAVDRRRAALAAGGSNQP